MKEKKKKVKWKWIEIEKKNTKRQSIFAAAAAAKSLQSCLTLCDPIDSSPSGSAFPGILQARTLEWVANSFSNAWKWKVKSEIEVTQLCPTLHNPMECSLPGSPVHGIFQARVLEWGAIAFNQGQMSFKGYKIIKVIQMKVKFTYLPKVFRIFMKKLFNL